MSSLSRELLIFGYLREIEHQLKLSYDIPIDIKLIIKEHYPKPFTFIKRNEDDSIHISQNGLSLTQKHDGWIYTQIGEFLSKSEPIAVTLIIEYIEEETSKAAIGFITPKFNEWTENRVNNGGNHTCMIYGDRILVTTNADFHYDEGNGNELTFLKMFKRRFFQNGDKLGIEIDMIENIGRIWNIKDETKVFQVTFATDTVAFCVFCGRDTHSFAILSQNFKYDNR